MGDGCSRENVAVDNLLESNLSQKFCDTIHLVSSRKINWIRFQLSTLVFFLETSLRSCEGWPNGFASRLASSHLCRLALGGQTVKNLRRLAYELELDQSQRKPSQVGGQTKCKLNASRKLALTCVDLRVGLGRASNPSSILRSDLVCCLFYKF